MVQIIGYLLECQLKQDNYTLLSVSALDVITVASLGLVSPGAATDAITLFFQKTDDLS